ncbi:hypothetical protein HPHPP2_1673 [Helicobacter pylori Hp P-2]|uniref:Uncharacterized protein n=1 Tax=Helicobacter pylori Hp P-2 TaxID=992073 RepID=J0PFT8_HELPX|nr:hypothetical protein HPHPP2_1673 [Helicobacter pylori Hp P-2]
MSLSLNQKSHALQTLFYFISLPLFLVKKDYSPNSCKK